MSHKTKNQDGPGLEYSRTAVHLYCLQAYSKAAGVDSGVNKKGKTMK